MADDASALLDFPFATGELPALPAGATVLVLGASAAFRQPQDFTAELTIVQGFRPDFLALRRRFASVFPQSQGDGYDCALVVVGRHRGENEARLLDATTRVRPGGMVVAAGFNADGAASLRKRLARLVSIDGHLSKNHGVVFWFRRDTRADAFVEAGAGAGNTLVEGRFHTAPGMFSHAHVDPGSQLLVDHLPHDVSGAVADFCAGWGYLGWSVASRFPAVKRLDLYEADFASIEAARANLAGLDGKPTGFHWHDLASEPVSERYDLIVMNPPFHTDRRAEPELGQAMIRAAATSLRPGGRLFLVANRQLPYERVIAEKFSGFSEVAANATFKVIAARR